MRILALETSTELGSCALLCDGTIDERFCPAGRSHSETLLGLVAEQLGSAAITINDLDAIAFGAGPGAFTGLRIACALAQGLAVASGVPVVPVGTLAAMAWQSGGQRVLTLLDARMGEVYWCAFEREGQQLRPVGEVALGRPDQIDFADGEEWLAVGNALAAYPDLETRARLAGYAADPAVMPGAGAVAALAAIELAAGRAIDPALAAPVYIRNKVAQTVAERLALGGRA